MYHHWFSIGDATNDGTTCAAGGSTQTEAFEALTFLKNCPTTAADSCDPDLTLFGGLDPLNFTEADIENCKNMLTRVKLNCPTDKNALPEENAVSSNEEPFNTLKHNIHKLKNVTSISLHQARTNSKQLSHDFITPVVSDCSEAFVKLSIPM